MVSARQREAMEILSQATQGAREDQQRLKQSTDGLVQIIDMLLELINGLAFEQQARAAELFP